MKAKHQRNPTLDYSPLGKSVLAFSTEALASSHAPHEGQGSASAADNDCIPAKHAAPLPPPPPPQPPTMEQGRQQPPQQQRECLAPAGSAWNPRPGAVEAAALPARRIASHKPNPSWFIPVMGFGGPSSVVWQHQQQQQAQEAALRRSQQREQERQQRERQGQAAEVPAREQGARGQQPPPTQPDMHQKQQLKQHSSTTTALPPQPSCAVPPAPPAAATKYPSYTDEPSAADLGSLSQQLPPAAPLRNDLAASQTPPPTQPLPQQQQQRSPPWYQQGWQQAQHQPEPKQPPISKPPQDTAAGPFSATVVYKPGGNPFAPAGAATAPSTAAPATSPAPASVGDPTAVGVLTISAVGCRQQARPPRPVPPGGAGNSGRRKLPPPPRFLVARPVQPDERSQENASEQQQSLPHGINKEEEAGQSPGELEQCSHVGAVPPAGAVAADARAAVPAPPPQAPVETGAEALPASRQAQQPLLDHPDQLEQDQEQQEQQARADCSSSSGI